MITELKPYPVYKDSGVDWLGEVPEDWEVRRLKHASEPLVNGLWGGDPDGENDIPCVRVADFDRERLVVRTPVPTTRAVTPAERGRRILRQGDLLLEKSGGGEQQPVGVVVEYACDDAAISSNFVARLRPRSDFVPRYLVYLHCTLYAKRINVRSIKQTTGIQNLDGGGYLGERVAFSSTSEQVAIARFLDHMDLRIQRLTQRIERISGGNRQSSLLGEYRTRLIADVVTGKLDVREAAANLPDNPDTVDLALDEELEEVAAG